MHYTHRFTGAIDKVFEYKNLVDLLFSKPNAALQAYPACCCIDKLAYYTSSASDLPFNPLYAHQVLQC